MFSGYSGSGFLPRLGDNPSSQNSVESTDHSKSLGSRRSPNGTDQFLGKLLVQAVPIANEDGVESVGVAAVTGRTEVGVEFDGFGNVPGMDRFHQGFTDALPLVGLAGGTSRG